jgi:phosphoglycerol transferase
VDVPPEPRSDAPASLKPARARALAAYLSALLLPLVAAILLLGIRASDLRVPFTYHGDAVSYALLVKSAVDHGWYLSNPDLGAPGGLQMHDFPYADQLHLVLIKAMSAFSHDWAVLFNLYFLIGFSLIALSALVALRSFRVPYGPALVSSVLYAFLPSRLLRGEEHIFLQAFFQVPLAMMMVLWVCGDDPPLMGGGPSGGLGLELRSKRAVASLLVCVLTATTGLYYAFFTAVLLVVGGAWASAERRSWRNVLGGLALAGTIAIVMGLAGLPTILHRFHHGRNPEVAIRGAAEAELHGATITSMLLPVGGHRVPQLRKLRQHYNETSPVPAEGSASALGVFASVGFVLLLWTVVYRRRDRPTDQLWRSLGFLNLASVAPATVGGFGALFAILVTPQIRAYKRINVIVGFFALFAVALLLERLYRRYPRLGRLALPLVLAVGLFDQVSAEAVRPDHDTRVEYAGDASFVRGIEAMVPPGAMIFQLPYLSFPEAPPVAQMIDYEPLRLYLHSHHLRWCYPTMRGRPGDLWLRDVSSRPAAALIAAVSDAGFSGIVVDRFGYDDKGRAIESVLGSQLGAPRAVSPNDRFVFFDMRGQRRQAQPAGTPQASPR